MKLLLDTANLDDIRYFNTYYPIEGVTTNPTILAREGGDVIALLKSIREIIGPDRMFHIQTTALDAENIVKEAIQWADVVAVGPGIGTDKTAEKLLTTVLKNSVRPIVIDADGLNVLAKEPKLWEIVPKGSVITPHPGEMSRLCDCSVSEILSDTVGICQGFARARNIVCVLKDHATVVSDGNDLYVNSTGNSGMATAGSGDVLAGMLAGLVATDGKMEPLQNIIAPPTP